MNDFKHLVHHDQDGRRIFYKDPPLLTKLWDWLCCAVLLALIYLFVVYLGG
jgi:hypothetical protein